MRVNEVGNRQKRASPARIVPEVCNNATYGVHILVAIIVHEQCRSTATLAPNDALKALEHSTVMAFPEMHGLVTGGSEYLAQHQHVRNIGRRRIADNVGIVRIQSALKRSPRRHAKRTDRARTRVALRLPEQTVEAERPRIPGRHQRGSAGCHLVALDKQNVGTQWMTLALVSKMDDVFLGGSKLTIILDAITCLSRQMKYSSISLFS